MVFSPNAGREQVLRRGRASVGTRQGGGATRQQPGSYVMMAVAGNGVFPYCAADSEPRADRLGWGAHVSRVPCMESCARDGYSFARRARGVRDIPADQTRRGIALQVLLAVPARKTLVLCAPGDDE